MIHTFSLLLEVTDSDIFHLFQKHGHDIARYNHLKAAVKQINHHISENYPALTVNWLQQKTNDIWLMSIKVDVLKVLNRGNVYDTDYLLIQDYITTMLANHAMNPDAFDNHTLTRIDYKVDVQVPDAKNRELLFHLFEKYTRRYRYKKLVKWGLDDKKNPLKYGTSQYHTNKSTELLIYSKEDERIAKNEAIKDYEKDIIRYELRLQNEHLNTMKRQKNGVVRPKKLSAYFCAAVFWDYMHNHVLPIVHNGDYYKLREAERIIEKSTFKRLKKDKLRKFLVSISKGSIDTPLKNGLSRPTYRQYLKDLETLNINPILIPKNRTDFPDSLANPFKIK